MERYIARQPIFDSQLKVYAYELLYRSGSDATNADDIIDGDRATQSLLSDAITVFGLPNLTNNKPAFVNFTEQLLFSDFPLLASPDEVSIEVLETITVNDALIERLEFLKEKGYHLALDDYTGDPQFDPILHLMDVIKVDFQATRSDMRRTIARRLRSKTRLLAEKVETQTDFEQAATLGYTLFQGYFFEKPLMENKRAPSLAASSYIRLFRELANSDIDIERCAWIVHSDATLTYNLFQKVSTMQYYRGNSIQNIIHALVLLGTDEIRRWVILLLARERNVTCSDELVRKAFLRATFAERLMEVSPHSLRSGDGFLMGMFSLLDKIMGMTLDEVLEEVPIPTAVQKALLGEEQNLFSPYLEFVLVYEMHHPALILPELDLNVSIETVADLYMQCIQDADQTFNN